MGIKKKEKKIEEADTGRHSVEEKICKAHIHGLGNKSNVAMERCRAKRNQEKKKDEKVKRKFQYNRENFLKSFSSLQKEWRVIKISLLNLDLPRCIEDFFLPNIFHSPPI